MGTSALFRSLKERGLHGVQLVSSDDHRGLVNAIQRHFQGASWQRCQVHFLRNARGKVARKHQAALTADLKAIFAAPDKGWALEAASGVVERWSATHPAVAAWIEEGVEDTLACYSFPEGHLDHPGFDGDSSFTRKERMRHAEEAVRSGDERENGAAGFGAPAD